jgi:DnaJ family protein C protein 17
MAPLLTDEESALDPYTILGVVVGATEKEITKAYRKASLKFHPDKNSSAEARMSSHNQASKRREELTYSRKIQRNPIISRNLIRPSQEIIY